MSMVKLSDDLMKVPKLDVGGKNWTIYRDRFSWSINARSLLHHIDGSSTEPLNPVVCTMIVQKKGGGTADLTKPDENEMVEAALSKDEEKLEKDWKMDLKVWQQGEAIVKQQIAATIPDSLFVKIKSKSTALEIWQTLMAQFQDKSRMVSMDLRHRLGQLRCAEKGDVRAHFEKMSQMVEDLASLGHPVNEDDLYAIILASLPPSFEGYISAMSATSSVLGTTLSSNDLFKSITDEYDRRQIGKATKKEENVAFYSNDGGRGGGGGSSSRKGVECFNCHK